MGCGSGLFFYLYLIPNGIWVVGILFFYLYLIPNGIWVEGILFFYLYLIPNGIQGEKFYPSTIPNGIWEEKMNHIKWILNEWRNHKLFILILVFLTCLSAFVAVIYPFLFKQLLDTLEVSLSNPDQDNPMSAIYKIIYVFIIVGLVKIITALYPGFRAYMNLLFEFIFRQRFFRSIVEKDYRFFLKFRTGDLVTRLTNDIQDFPKIGWFMCSGIFRAFDALVKIIFCVVAMFLICADLTLFVLIPIPLMVIAFFIISERLHKSFKHNQEAISEINNQLEMTFSGIKIIKSYVC